MGRGGPAGWHTRYHQPSVSSTYKPPGPGDHLRHEPTRRSPQITDVGLDHDRETGIPEHNPDELAQLTDTIRALHDLPGQGPRIGSNPTQIVLAYIGVRSGAATPPVLVTVVVGPALFFRISVVAILVPTRQEPRAASQSAPGEDRRPASLSSVRCQFPLRLR